MTASENELDQPSPPVEFVEQVRQTLAHLYDMAYLQQNPLALPGNEAAVSGQRLRWELAGAIEGLNPGPGVPFLAPHARQYNLLSLHYVQRMNIQEVADTLAISLRQTYRDLRRAEEGLAAVLWARRRAASAPGGPEERWLSSPEMEIARLETRHESTDLALLLLNALNTVRPLALQRSVSLQLEASASHVPIAANPVMAQQVLVAVLSSAVRSALGETVRVLLDAEGGQLAISLAYAPDPQAVNAPMMSPVTSQLADRLGWRLTQEDEPAGRRRIRLTMGVHGRAVLVVDDNEGLVQLLERYLSEHNCRVTAALGGPEGLRMAEALLPDAIILDIMMPEMDGWEFLQRLRALPRTAAIPVIVCSVIQEPDLAYALQASAFLPKPVGRYEVLAALHKLGVV